MVEIRVAVTDPTRVHGLMRRLGRLFDRSAVAYDGARREVRVRSEWESRSVVEVIDRPVVARSRRSRFGRAVGRRSLLHDGRSDGGPCSDWAGRMTQFVLLKTSKRAA
jgi:hypothetical protein